MMSQKKLKILTSLQKLPKNDGDLGKLIVAKGFEKLPKVQYIVQTGHTAGDTVLSKQVSSQNCAHHKYFLFRNIKNRFTTRFPIPAACSDPIYSFLYLTSFLEMCHKLFAALLCSKVIAER